MAGVTPKLGLRKPAGTDLVNVTTDLDNNFDTIDAACGFKRKFSVISGNLVLNNVAWTAVATSILDIIMKATVGDYIEVKVGGVWNNEPVAIFLDVQSIVSTAPVSAWGTVKSGTDSGLPASAGAASVTTNFFSGGMRQVVAGDLDVSGNISLRPVFRTSSAGNKTLFATNDFPFTFWVINHGQP